MTELQDHLSVGRRDDILKKLIRGVNSFLDVGRYFGSSIRRFIGGNSCPLK